MVNYFEWCAREILSIFYSYLEFENHVRFSGTNKTLRLLGEILLPRDLDFEKKKLNFILSRLVSEKIWGDTSPA